MKKDNFLSLSVLFFILINFYSCIFIKNAIAEEFNMEDSKAWIEDEKIQDKMESIHFVEDYNKYKGYTLIRPQKREELGGLDLFTQVYLDIMRYEGSSNFFLGRVIFSGTNWSGLNGNLYLILNGKERIHLEGETTGSEVLECYSSGCRVAESMNVVIPDNILLKMYKANSIEVLVEGDKYSLEAYLKKDHHAQIRVLVENTDIKVGNNN